MHQVVFLAKRVDEQSKAAGFYQEALDHVARLRYYHAASGDLLSCLPLQLTLRGKSTTQSYRTPIYYVDLTLLDDVDLQDVIRLAEQRDELCKAVGF
ncbi:hypothetical protein EC846_2755 [Acinetobacter sp. BIGb0102]|nr:hypothetical protein EC846_2755 [Acinetobacter sp. BIGb0102]